LTPTSFGSRRFACGSGGLGAGPAKKRAPCYMHNQLGWCAGLRNAEIVRIA
jgi:hypothetical protein